MTIQFCRPVGLHAELNELKYVAALLQTSDDRPEGTISATDIQCLLRSRFNVNLTDARALIRVLCGRDFPNNSGRNADEMSAGSGTGSDQEENDDNEQNRPETTEENSTADTVDEVYMNFTELLAVLMIPTLVTKREELVETGAMNNSSQTDTGDPPTYPEFLRHGLRALLADQTEPLLTVDLVHDLLCRHGYTEMAENNDLVQEMVDFAGSTTRLDEPCLLTALTFDVGCLVTEEEIMKERTSVANVTNTNEPIDENQSDDLVVIDEEEQQLDGNDDKDNKEQRRLLILQEKLMFQHTKLDFVADAQSSTILVVLVWTFFILSSLSFSSIIQAAIPSFCGDSSFWCQFISTIQVWFIYVLMFSLAGIASIVPLSLSNDPHDTRIWPSIVVLCVAVVYTFSPIKSFAFPDSVEGVNSGVLALLRIASVLSGCLLCLFVAYRIALRICRSLSKNGTFKWDYLLIPSHRIIQDKLEMAASHKLTGMLDNAGVLVGCSDGGDRTGDWDTKHETGGRVKENNGQICGGLWWTWERILSGELLQREGLLIPTRVFVFQFCQMFVVGLATFVFFQLVEVLSRAAEDQSRELEQLLDRMPSDIEAPPFLTSFIPTRRAIESSLYPAASISTVAMLVTVSLYVPSITSTIIKFRSGVIPSVGTQTFSSNYKLSVSDVYMNTGNAITGIIATGGVFYFVFGFLIFLFCWEVTAQSMIVFSAWCLGATVTILLKMLVTSLAVKASFQGFFRQRVLQANIVTVMLEMWYISLASSLLIVRVCQFLLASAFWVGRIDETFLHENVTIFGLERIIGVRCIFLHLVLLPQATCSTMYRGFLSPTFSYTNPTNTRILNAFRVSV